uniref:Uncharacterized protein n=1 Tax=Cyanistes caeruleus TaxID=156563 RepID=A0A8C0V103_CYACU
TGLHAWSFLLILSSRCIAADQRTQAPTGWTGTYPGDIAEKQTLIASLSRDNTIRMSTVTGTLGLYHLQSK